MEIKSYCRNDFNRNTFFSYEPRKDGSWNVKEGRKKLSFSRDKIKMLIFVAVLHELNGIAVTK